MLRKNGINRRETGHFQSQLASNFARYLAHLRPAPARALDSRRDIVAECTPASDHRAPDQGGEVPGGQESRQLRFRRYPGTSR